MNLLEQIAEQIFAMAHFKNAIGAALTKKQRLAVSELVFDGPSKFITWTKTEDGRKAVQDFANAFVASKG